MDENYMGDDGQGEAEAAAGEAEAMQQIWEEKSFNFHNAINSTRDEPVISIGEIATALVNALDKAEIESLLKEINHWK